MANVGDLKVLLSADDKASGQVAKSGRNIKETAKGMGKSFALMGGVIAGVFAGAIKDFMDTGAPHFSKIYFFSEKKKDFLGTGAPYF